MTKTDLIGKVNDKVEGITKKKVAEVVEAVFDAVHDALVAKEKVQVVGFGTFETQHREARQGRNPQDPKKVIQIPAKTVPVFRAGKQLKEDVNSKKTSKSKKK